MKTALQTCSRKSLIEMMTLKMTLKDLIDPRLRTLGDKNTLSDTKLNVHLIWLARNGILTMSWA